MWAMLAVCGTMVLVLWAMLAVCGTMVFSHVGYACIVWNHSVLSCGLCLQCVEPWCSVMWAMLAM